MVSFPIGPRRHNGRHSRQRGRGEQRRVHDRVGRGAPRSSTRLSSCSMKMRHWRSPANRTTLGCFGAFGSVVWDEGFRGLGEDVTLNVTRTGTLWGSASSCEHFFCRGTCLWVVFFLSQVIKSSLLTLLWAKRLQSKVQLKYEK